MSDGNTPINSDVKPPQFQRKATFRLGQRELSLLSTAVIALVVVGLLYGGYRVKRTLQARRDLTLAQANMLAIYKALNLYAQDWDGQLPPAANWNEAVAGYLTGSEGQRSGTGSVLRGPGDGALVGYAYNELAAGYNLEPKPSGEDKQATLGPPKGLVLLIEKEGAGDNATVRIPPLPEGEETLAKQLDFPHFKDNAKEAATVVLLANGSTTRYKRVDFDPQAGAE